jgi:Uma2 family endonuclease
MESVRKDARYTYADYATWPEDERWELIDGVPYAMATPSVIHQRISRKLMNQLSNWLEGKPCEPFAAPFAVRLNADKGDDTVVEPDISVVCDKSKLADGKSCVGAPDLVIEILSPSTSRHDRLTKYNLYRAAGVREYWIVDPTDKIVTVSHFEKGVDAAPYGETDEAPVGVLPGCVIDLSAVFAE